MRIKLPLRRNLTDNQILASRKYNKFMQKILYAYDHKILSVKAPKFASERFIRLTLTRFNMSYPEALLYYSSFYRTFSFLQRGDKWSVGV